LGADAATLKLTSDGAHRGTERKADRSGP